MTEWEPSTEPEAAMRDALRANDQERYFRILARGDLLLPVTPQALAGQAPMGWGTWAIGGRTHVLAFTSNAALQSCLPQAAGSARVVRYHDLAGSWPNPEWWLAVNPGLPIEGYLPAWYVAQLADGDVRLPRRPSVSAQRSESPVRARAAVPVPGQITPPEVHPVRPANPFSPTFAGVPAGVPAAAEPALQAASPRRGAEPRLSSASPPWPDARVPAEAVDQEFTPANEVEIGLLAAVGEGSTNSLLSTLLLAKVLLPATFGADRNVRPGDEGFTWRTELLDGERCVVVFTSPERLADHLPDPVEAVDVRFAQLIRHWPDGGWSFAVNPGTPVGVRLSGSQVLALANRAAEVGLGEDSEEAVPAETPVVAQVVPRSVPGREDPIRPPNMQKIIPPDHVDYYLERGYDRVSGFVNRANELAHLTTPAQLIDALGLGYPGSPFSAGAEELYVLRWPAYRPSLYRIPYGGQNEAAMRAMEGWVIERAPFRGNGFAPGESGDIIAEFKVDSVRLPHGAQLWRIRADGTEQIVALFDSDAPTWRRVGT